MALVALNSGRYIYIYIHTHTYIHIHAYIHVHVHTYIYIYIHTYIYIYIYIHIHTHTHIYIILDEKSLQVYVQNHILKLKSSSQLRFKGAHRCRYNCFGLSTVFLYCFIKKAISINLSPEVVQSHLLPFRNLGNFVHPTFASVFRKRH